MRTFIKNTAIALAAGGMAVTAVPAAAFDFGSLAQAATVLGAQDSAGYGDRWDRRYRDSRYRDNRYSNYDQPVYRDTRVWQGRDGQYYCRKKDGTTGLIIGAAAGALLGREVDKYGDRTLGTILGGAAGALLGKKVDSGTRCR